MRVYINPRDSREETVKKNFFTCGNCGNQFILDDDNYCSKCCSEIHFRRSWPFGTKSKDDILNEKKFIDK